MSGFEDRSGVYGLTPTKAMYWHRARIGENCCGGRLGDIVEVHCQPAGFTVVKWGKGRGWCTLIGPGLENGWTADLWQAISGAPDERLSRDPARQWRY
jgi:hypothetical protein